MEEEEEESRVYERTNSLGFVDVSSLRTNFAVSFLFFLFSW